MCMPINCVRPSDIRGNGVVVLCWSPGIRLAAAELIGSMASNREPLKRACFMTDWIRHVRHGRTCVPAQSSFLRRHIQVKCLVGTAVIFHSQHLRNRRKRNKKELNRILMCESLLLQFRNLCEADGWRRIFKEWRVESSFFLTKQFERNEWGEEMKISEWFRTDARL